jgi:hypothetical protein
VEIKVKRNTGMMGGATKVSLIVDGKEEKKLKNNEEYIIATDKGSTTLKAKQWFFGSKEIEVKGNESVEIKVNSIGIFLYLISMVLIFSSVAIDVREIKLVLALVGIISIIITFIYTIKSWFILNIVK